MNAVLAKFAEPSQISVERRAAGAFTIGVYAPGALTTVLMTASVRPFEPTKRFGGSKASDTKPEGKENRGAILIYTAVDEPLLRASQADQTPADVVLWDGRRWQVQSCDVRAQIASLAHCQTLAFEEDAAG